MRSIIFGLLAASNVSVRCDAGIERRKGASGLAEKAARGKND
jgi:hypothetical protein